MSSSTCASKEHQTREGYVSALVLETYPSQHVQDSSLWRWFVTPSYRTTRERAEQPRSRLQPPHWSGYPYAQTSHAIVSLRGVTLVFPSTAANLVTSDGPALIAGVRRPVGNQAAHSPA